MVFTSTRITSLLLLFMLSSGQPATGPFIDASKEVFQNCTAGHNTYQIDPKPETCCKKVYRDTCREGEITRCIITPEGYGCRAAIMLFYGNVACCVGQNLKWVKEKLEELKKMGKPCQKATTPPSKKCP